MSKPIKYLDLIARYKKTPYSKRLQFFKIALEQAYHQGRLEHVTRDCVHAKPLKVCEDCDSFLLP